MSTRITLRCMCGNTMTIQTRDADRFPKDWTCPCCEDEERAEILLARDQHSIQPITATERDRT